MVDATVQYTEPKRLSLASSWEMKSQITLDNAYELIFNYG
jgi:hypothetical protein